MSDNKLDVSEAGLPEAAKCECSDRTSDPFCVCEHEATYNSSVEERVATTAGYYSMTDESVFKYVNESAQPEVDLYYFYANEQFAILWILFLLIVLGNSAVLIALFLERKRKSRMNFFIMQLALADLTVGVFYVLTDIIWRMTVAWHAGNLGCKIIRFLQAVVIYSSTYVLVALSIDRYDAITHPMNFSGSSRRARVLVILAWFFSVVFSIPIVIFYEEKYVQKKLQCWIDFDEPWQWQLYLTLISVALFFLPAIIISACYTVIVFTIWSKGKLLTHSSAYKSGARLYKWKRENSEEMDTRRASSRGLIPRAKIKTVKMTFTIVFVFILCWSPYFIFDLLQVYGYFPTNQASIATASFIQSLAPLNSAANPLIYCAFSTHFCRALRKIPPFRWFISAADSSDKSFGSATVTESLTSRRSGISLRHHNHIKMHADESQIAEAAVTAV